MEKKYMLGMVGVFSAVLFGCLLVIDAGSIPRNAVNGKFAGADALVVVWAVMLAGSVWLVRWSRRE